MSQALMRLFMLISLLILSGCTSTVRGVNYELYKGRLQAQTYLTGRVYKPIPMMLSRKNIRARKRVYQASNKRRHYQIANNRAKKIIVRRIAVNPKRILRKPAVKVGKAYKPKSVHRARVVYKRPIVRRAAKVQPHRRASVAYQRPVLRKPIRRVQQRKVKAVYTYKRPVVRKPYIAPRKRRVVQQPKPVAPLIPVNQLNDGLFSAAKAGNIVRMNTLLGQGAQINSSNMSRETPLHAAAALGRRAAVSLLLQKGANPNATTTGGWTPLHSAARFRHTQIVRLLVAKGAQVNRRNNQGKTPVALATQVGASTTATALIALGG